MLTVITVIVVSALLFRYIHSLTEVQGSLKRLESLMSSMSENIAAIRRQGEGEPVPVEKERESVIEEAPVPQPQPQPEANIQMVEPKPKAKTPPPPVTFTPMQHFDLPVAEPAEVTPPPPSEPTKMGQWANAAWNWLCVGEEWRPGWIPGEYAVAAVQLLRAAALLLLFGAAWFVRYIHEQGFFSPMGRVVAGFVLAAALVVAGSRLLRNQWRPLGLVLAGLGFALGEFFDWAGANLYGVIPASGAFAIAAVLALGAGAMAWRHASLLMGLVALFAGYSAPLFFPEAVRVGDVVLLAWLLLLAAEGAALAMTRGWRCLTWITLVATIALAAPVFEPNRLAALGRGWALGIIALFAIFTWTESLGHALLHRHAPLKFDLVSWVAVTAVSAMAGIVTTYVHVFSYGFYHWPLLTHGLPALVLAVGGLALALAFHLRGIGDRATFEWLIDGVSALVLAFACHSFEGTPRCVALCVAAVCFVLIAARQGNAIQAICALLAWVLWLVYVGTPASAAERIGRIGPMVASLWASGLLLRRMKVDGSRYTPVILWAAWVASLAWATWEVHNAYLDFTPSIVLYWGAHALATLVVGLLFDRRDVRGVALCLFAAAAGKFLIIDQAGAPTTERVAGFLGVGLLLLLGSAGYIRAAGARKRPETMASN